MDETKPTSEPAAEAPERPIDAPKGAEGEAGEGLQCESCGRSFANRDELQAHVARRHTEEAQPTTSAA